MTTHDPRKLLESLRNHLTQPETNVAFLLGAGTSCAVRIAVPPEPGADVDAPPKTRSLIPNVTELTAICVKEIKKLDPPEEPARFGLAYDAIEKELSTSG